MYSEVQDLRAFARSVAPPSPAPCYQRVCGFRNFTAHLAVLVAVSKSKMCRLCEYAACPGPVWKRETMRSPRRTWRNGEMGSWWWLQGVHVEDLEMMIKNDDDVFLISYLLIVFCLLHVWRFFLWDLHLWIILNLCPSLGQSSLQVCCGRTPDISHVLVFVLKCAKKRLETTCAMNFTRHYSIFSSMFCSLMRALLVRAHNNLMVQKQPKSLTQHFIWEICMGISGWIKHPRHIASFVMHRSGNPGAWKHWVLGS